MMGFFRVQDPDLSEAVLEKGEAVRTGLKDTGDLI